MTQPHYVYFLNKKPPAWGTTAVEKCKGLTTFMYTIPYLFKYVDKSAQNRFI